MYRAKIKSFIKIVPDILWKAHLTMSRALPTDIHRQIKIETRLVLGSLVYEMRKFAKVPYSKTIYQTYLPIIIIALFAALL